MRDWLYFYALDWSRGEERREVKCSSGGFRLFEMLLLPWRSAAGGSRRRGAAPHRSSAKPTEGKSTETFYIVFFFCFWLPGHGAKRAWGNCGGNCGNRLTLGETTSGTKLPHCLPQPAKREQKCLCCFFQPLILIRSKVLTVAEVPAKKKPNL